MINASLPLLTLNSSNVAVTGNSPSVTMVTTTSSGSTFSIGLKAIAENTTIKVDWGNGTLTDYTIGTTSSNISGTLAGNTINIYGSYISYLNVTGKNLTSLDISGSNSIKELYCNGNSLMTLDVSSKTTLTDLDCRGNLLNSLNLANATALRSLYCYTNKLTNLDVSTNTALVRIECYRNLLKSIDVSKNTALIVLYCMENQLSTLDVSKNSELQYLNCNTNQLTFSTLPINQVSWYAYTYSPQAVINLPQKSYDLQQKIDIISQLSANGTTTNYTWKTKAGITLIAGTDYNIASGLTTFIKAQSDSVYCQMTNSSFPLLTLKSSTIAITTITPSVTMTTTTSSGSTFTFGLKAITGNTPIKVDWGNGALSEYTIGTTISDISGALTGNTIKIYGSGISYLNLTSKNLTSLDIFNCNSIKELYCNGNMLTTLDVSNKATLTDLDCRGNFLTSLNLTNAIALKSLFCYTNKLTTLNVSTNTALVRIECYRNLLTSIDVSKNTALIVLYCMENQFISIDVSKNTALEYLICHTNKLTFNSLPVKQLAWTTYTYSPQAKIELSKKAYNIFEYVDLSSQYSINGNTTEYKWKKKEGTELTLGVDYTQSNGRFYFKNALSDSVYCEMTNATFPDLNLTTNTIAITLPDPAITMTTTSTIGSVFSFYIQTIAIDTPVLIDWGDGIINKFTIGTSSTNISGALKGNVISIYGTGISYLYLYANMLTALNVSKCISLTQMDCQYNQLTTLDISKNIGLTTLSCNYNQLTELDVSKNIALSYLSCANNQLENIDVTKNIALGYFDFQKNKFTTIDLSKNASLYSLNCSFNSLSTIDVSKNTNLQWFICTYNLLSNLDVSKNTKLLIVDCNSNNLTFSSLPIKQTAWTTYTYSPQSKIELSKKAYNIFESVDLISQYSINENITEYKWKKKAGAELTLGVDYTQSNGRFYFKNALSDSIYCEMTNATFPNLTLTTSTMAVILPDPAISMTTSTQNGSAFSFTVSAISDDTPILVDWGNSSLISYTIGTIRSSILGTLAGSTIRVYGAGISSLDLQSKNITALDISRSTALTDLICFGNSLAALDITKNVALTYLNCGSNTLTALDISMNTGLTEFSCSNNSLITIDVSHNTALKRLLCYSNNLSSLDVTKNSSLIYLECSANKLSTLDITMSPGITEIYCNGNSISALDVTKNTVLQRLNCSYNNLLALDVSKNSSLELLLCSNNKLSALDVSNSNALKYLYCNNNSLTALDVSMNTALKELFCYDNHLSALDVSKNLMLLNLECYSNQMKFNTLPAKQSSWTNYLYSPQKRMALQKKNFTISETIDLSSELTVNGNTTTYAWKTKGGNSLVVGIDYNITNGLTTFLKTQSDSVYCQMLNASLPQLTLNSSNISIVGNMPVALTMATTTAVGSSFSFDMKATTNNTPIKVDWGNGIYKDYTIGTTSSSISGILAGATVKIYGSNTTYLNLTSKNLTSLDVSGCNSIQELYCNGNTITSLDLSNKTALTYLDCRGNLLTSLNLTNATALRSLYCYTNKLTSLDVSTNTALVRIECYRNLLTSIDVSKNIALEVLYCMENQLTALDVSKNSALAYLICNTNQLTFNTLPIKKTSWYTYTYSPQAVINLPQRSYSLGQNVNLSSQLSANGVTTNYVWKTKGGTNLILGTDYSFTNGTTTFLKTQTDSVYCQMTNTTFPGLTLSTTNVKVTQFPSSVNEVILNGKIYPNPIKDILNIECEESIQKVEVYSIIGMKVFENAVNNLTSTRINTSLLPKGLLVVKVYGKSGVMEKKIIKE